MVAIYTPPELPPYIANSYDLKPVEGVPSDDEVKLIHAVIRAVENVSQGEETSILWWGSFFKVEMDSSPSLLQPRSVNGSCSALVRRSNG